MLQIPLNLRKGLATLLIGATILSPIGTEFTFVPFTPTEAKADAVDRRVARRTSRRVTRRHANYNDYKTSVTGCSGVKVNGVSYWQCGNVYYQGIVDEGETIYIVVNL